MRRFSIFLFSILFFLPISLGTIYANEPPKLVVNVVVSQMRYDYLLRFGKNFTEQGFNRFVRNGLVFTDARYDFMQTITPSTLATLTTGANPSTHGVVAEQWIDYTTNRTIHLIEDSEARGVGSDMWTNRYSDKHITVSTLGDRLKEQHKESKVVTLALDPTSAIVMGGHTSDVYWMDEERGKWVTSTAYKEELPNWVGKYNELEVPGQYLNYRWRPYRSRGDYVNVVFAEMEFGDGEGYRRLRSLGNGVQRSRIPDYKNVMRSPAGNSLVTEFAKQAVLNEELGKGFDRTDMLNICYDTPRYIGEVYGGESLEVEDMFYRMDREIADLIEFLYDEVGKKNVVVVLTSDHGASDSYDYRGKERERFNVGQLRIITNGFMAAQYGSGDWVIDCFDRQLYFNRDLIYNKGLSLDEVQRRVAAFVLQFHGVSHVLTSTSMQNSYFSNSYAEKMQNSFYPKRSGDLMINLMPGWIEEDDDVRSLSGSMYEYDTHVPLMMLGDKFFGQQVTRPINMRDIAPTVARIMKISRPIAAEGQPIEEVIKLYR